MNVTRRGFLKTVSALVGTRLATNGWLPSAQAASSEPATIIMFHLVGGMNAFYGSAATLQGKFGITATNFTKFGPVAIDNTLADALPAFAQQHVAAIGVRHGISAHPTARNALFANAKGQCTPLVLASAMGGTASLKACILGANLMAEKVNTAAVNSVSLQRINDMESVIESLGGSVPGPKVPDRASALAGLAAARTLSTPSIGGEGAAMTNLGDSYGAIIDTLAKPGAIFNFDELSTAYKLTGKTAINSVQAQFAAAELMTHAGANVVVIQNRGWDSHKDVTGNAVRKQFEARIKAPLTTFLDRMLNRPDRNVVVTMFGDFSRSLPNSDHQPNLTALVFGKYVKRGSTGATSANVALPPGCPSVPGYWAYVAAAAKMGSLPFGANAHGLIL